jgi:hypothetical protein
VKATQDLTIEPTITTPGRKSVFHVRIAR